MTSDRELLALAAKAAGYTLEDQTDANGLYWPWCVELGDNWCPLTDDGDAFRLAVTLSISTWHSLNGAYADHEGLPIDMSPCREDAREDRIAATRRAITRAAAEIGRGMP